MVSKTSPAMWRIEVVASGSELGWQQLLLGDDCQPIHEAVGRGLL